MSYRFGKLWHLAIIWAIRKAFQCILQGVRFLLANHTRLSPTSENESYRGVATSISNGIILLNNFIISCNWQQMEVPADYPAITITGLIIRWCSYREAESRWDNQNHRGSLLSSYFLFLLPLEDHLHFFFLANKMLHHQLYKLSLTKKMPIS